MELLEQKILCMSMGDIDPIGRPELIGYHMNYHASNCRVL